jgi:hypothetical protein
MQLERCWPGASPEKLTMLDGKTGISRTIVDIEKAAKVRVSEESRDGLRFRPVDPADAPYSHEETAQAGKG